jgi:hypothetical protein
MGSWAQGFICLGAMGWLLLKHSVIGFCFYTWAQGFICLGAMGWLLLKHSVIGFVFIGWLFFRKPTFQKRLENQLFRNWSWAT